MTRHTRPGSGLTYFLFIAILSLLMTSGAFAATEYTVDQSAGAGDFTTIAAALAVAVSGDRVVVNPGTYYENNLDFNGNIILQSAEGPEVTVINGNNNGQRVFLFDNGMQNSAARLDGFTVTGGTHPYGGALSTGNGSTCPTITNMIFENNHSAYGGAIRLSGDALIERCIFRNNSAYNSYYSTPSGGALQLNSFTGSIRSCLFLGNQATVATQGPASGGAISVGGTSEVKISNCTFLGNQADSYGGVIDNNAAAVSSASVIIANSIFWGNSSGDGSSDVAVNRSSGNINFEYCDIEGLSAQIENTGTGLVDVVNCMNIYPQFDTSPKLLYHLTSSSPCINSGTNSPTGQSLSARDLDAKNRIDKGEGVAAKIVDIGAYEYCKSESFWVNPNGSEDFTNIAAAVNSDLVGSGDTIILSPGTYTGSDNTNVYCSNRDITLRSVTDSDPSDTVIDFAESSSSDRWYFSGEENKTVIWGITLQNKSGGYRAIEIYDGSLTIENCTIRKNVLDGSGPITIFNPYLRLKSVTRISECRFSDNISQGAGGAIQTDSYRMIGMVGLDAKLTDLLVEKCAFNNNIATGGGGAIKATAPGSVTIRNSIFTDNQALVEGSTAGDGGALYLSGIKNIFVENSLFIDNQADSGGAVCLNSAGLESPSATFSFCTLKGNQATHLLGWGGGLFFNSPDAENSRYNFSLHNSIIWGNRCVNPLGGNQMSGFADHFTVKHVDLEGGVAAMGFGSNSITSDLVNIIDVDPEFVAGTVNLTADSPCIDAGYDSASDPVMPEYDLTGTTDRVINGIPDLGVYENDNLSVVAVPETLEFTYRVGGMAPDIKSLELINNGTEALAWSIESDVAWLNIQPAAAPGALPPGESVSVSVLVDPEAVEAMSEGVHSATLSIKSGSAPDPIRSVPVKLSVTRALLVGPSPAPYSNIQDAVDNANDGDTILVEAGTYGGFDFKGKAITVCSVNGPAYTAIDGLNVFPHAITFALGEKRDSIIDGFSFSRFYNSAIVIESSASPTIVNCNFSGNGATENGGCGIRINGAWNTWISNCAFINNNTTFVGGGIYINNGFFNSIIDCTFKENTAHDGGGIYLEGALVVPVPNCNYIKGCEFEKNNAVMGGGIDAEFSGNDVIEACTFRGNKVTDTGGSIYSDDSSIIIANSLFVGNKDIYDNDPESPEALNANAGGAIFQHDGNDNDGIYSQIINCTITKCVSNIGGGGIYIEDPSTPVVNTILFNNINKSTTSFYEYVGEANFKTCFIDNHNPEAPNDPGFVNYAGGDYRLTQIENQAQDSTCIDNGTTVSWLYSDVRGSLRPVNGSTAAGGVGTFDIGAYEFSRYYSGDGLDQVAKPFIDFGIESSVILTGHEYEVEWKDNTPLFPANDERINQPGEYKIRLALVNDHGLRIDLIPGPKVMRTSTVGYSLPITFTEKHLGTWRLRIEMFDDINLFVESEPFTIENKSVEVVCMGERIFAPNGALADQKPDVDIDKAVYWSDDAKRLWAVKPATITITWYEDENRTKPISMVRHIEKPDNPQNHIAATPPVALLPEASPYETVNLLYSSSGAAISGNNFTAENEGYSVLLFNDEQGASFDDREFIKVVRTVEWNHQSQDENDAVDFPIEQTGYLGEELAYTDDQAGGENRGHDETLGGGYVFFENGWYDGYGENRAYIRETREGPIFPVNGVAGDSAGDFGDVRDNIVVVWYRKSTVDADSDGIYETDNTEIGWPCLPVRHEIELPSSPETIVIASGLGSGALEPMTYGAQEDMLIYNQPDPEEIGFNPNEEHAAFFTAQGSEYPAVFALRDDLNGTTIGDYITSPPYVLLKYRDPLNNNQWNFKVYKVVAEDATYTFRYDAKAGTEINPFYPLNQLCFGPCEESFIEAGDEPWVLNDKDDKFFAINGGINGGTQNIGIRYFYRLQAGFFYDRDHDLVQDTNTPIGTPIPFLDGGEKIVPENPPDPPRIVNFDVSWPEDVPTLYVGETLMDAKLHAGDPKGLPNIKDQCSVRILFDQAVEQTGDYDKHSVNLIDPLKEHEVDYEGLTDPEHQLPQNLEPKMNLGTGRFEFTALPEHLKLRLSYDPADEKLKLRGYYQVDTGEPTILLNALTTRDIDTIYTLLADDPAAAAFMGLLNSLNQTANEAFAYPASGTVTGTDRSYPELSQFDAESKALTAGDARGTGYVTLEFNNYVNSVTHQECSAPTMLSVIKVGGPLYVGEIKVIESPNPFEERLTLRHNGDFGGQSDSKWLQWKYVPAGFSGIPCRPDQTPGEDGCVAVDWQDYFAVVPCSGTVGDDKDPHNGTGNDMFYKGAVDVTVQGTGQQLLGDKWFSVRYLDGNDPPLLGSNGEELSAWTRPQLYEGWVKRVMKKINLFDQKAKDFHAGDVNTLASMIALAGEEFEGPIALSDSPEYLQSLGMIEVYETLLERAVSLATYDSPDINKALLFAANRLADLYMLLGNEAYGDAADPTIGFSTESGTVGSEASSIFCFENQVDSLLDEELALLRGRGEKGIRPYYNRLVWNFTLGDGEVAYKENYNITDQNTLDSDGDTFPDTPDGEINEMDAKLQFPQGHGDAWGYYLSAVKSYYRLLNDQNFTWIPQSEAILVAGNPVQVDYRDERKFAVAAAARARTGAEVVNLTYRKFYTENPKGQWQGYKDTDSDRAWGLDGWSRRAGQAAFFDWVAGNAVLPTEPTVFEGQYATADDQTNDLKVFHLNNLKPVDPSDLSVYVNGHLQTSCVSNVTFYPETQDDPAYTEVTVTCSLLEGDEVVFEMALVDASFEIRDIQKIDRSTVVELGEICTRYDEIQAKVDQADAQLNPLGLAKEAVPFDIDPSRVANGETHFEQIYGRAVEAMNNAISVFNHANRSTNLLRQQQDSLADFQRNVENMEADYNNRLIEVFGYPYPDDCGPGRTYPTSYCDSGPDLYHYMYYDPADTLGVVSLVNYDEENPGTYVEVYERPLETYEYQVKLTSYEINLESGLEPLEIEVPFNVAVDSRFGIVKPDFWEGQRKAPGEIQQAHSNLLQNRGHFVKALAEYVNLCDNIEMQAEMIKLQIGVNLEEIRILDTAKNKQLYDLNDKIMQQREDIINFQTKAKYALLIGNAAAEAFPQIAGWSFDLTSSVRAATLAAANVLAESYNSEANEAQLTELSQQQAKEEVSLQTNIEVTTLKNNLAVAQALLQLENLIRSETLLRLELYNLMESLRQSAASYLAVLARGSRLLADRLRFRRQTAAQIQDYRYKDMAFRIFRNDALQRYRAQFDMAARYVYLAAKAYDYDTMLLSSDSRAGEDFLTDIVKQRTIGLIENGLPLTGSGLADPMKRMYQNFQILKPQLGFNNPQIETNRFSLRQEQFRIKQDDVSDEKWCKALDGCVVDNLWDVPEFRRYCRPFAPEGEPEPGLVIPFTTTVTAGLNFFGWPLGGGDSYYSATNFATKIRAAGIWFSNYNSVGLTQTPRVYLVPVGEDVLRSPSVFNQDIRTWQVVDQKLPLPFPVNETEIENDLGWIPTVDSIFDEMFGIRRHSDFRAYHDSGYLNESEMNFDTRLIGRSVWNSKWLLIIPGRNLLYDPVDGLNTFIHGPKSYINPDERTENGISDIKLFFETYSYSGN